LGLTLFIRDPRGVRLTDAGQRVLRYCQITDHLETELLNDLVKAPSGKLGGRLRICGYSSVMHSVIMPALAPMLRENPNVQFEFSVYEMGDLPGALERAECDFVVMDHANERNNIQSVLLGQESYVLIKSSQFATQDVFLDHDPEDRLTEQFFQRQSGKVPALKRCFVDDIQGVLQGVALGLGKGIVPRHLLPKNSPVKELTRYKPMHVPVVLQYFKQSFYTNLQKSTIEVLKKNCCLYLADG
jgi:DNA-binding transcriptional LysR family regulator